MSWYNPFSWFQGDSRRVGIQSPMPATTAPTVKFDTAMSVSAFWASVRLLTEVVASMPIRCYDIDIKNSTKSINTNNELWRLMAYNPNRYQSTTEFWESIMLNLVTWGNAYVAIERSASGKIISLLPLVSSQMEPRLLEDGAMVYQYTTADSSIKVFSDQSIWHIKIFGNGLVGLSPLGYAAGAINTASNLERRMNVLASNGGKTNGILTIDKVLTDKQREAIKANFSAITEGNADQLFVLEADMQYQQTSLSPSDIQLIENRRFQVEDIARFMGVPSVLINDTSATTTWGSGIEQITQGFYKLNLRPYLERIESSIQRNLMPATDWGNTVIEFDFDTLLRADKATRIDAASKGVNAGILTPNEARAEEGLGDKTGGDDIYLNGSLVPAGQQQLQRGSQSGTQAP